MSITGQETKAFNGVVGTKFTPLNDLDNRFSIKISNRHDNELRNELARYATRINEGNEYSAAVTKTREGGPYATILKDTASGREFAVIAYRSLDKNYPDTMPPADPYISTNYTIGELAGGKLVGTPAEAMAKMGLQEDMGFPVDNKSAVPGDEQWWLTQGLQNMIKNHQKQNRLELVEGGAKADQRSIMYRQTQFDYGINEHLDEKEMLMESTIEKMVHHRDASVDSKITQDDRNHHYSRMWRELDKLQEQKAEALKAIISPEKFMLDEDNRILPADGVDLANRYAQTSGDKMTMLGDINNLNRVGRVSEEALQASTVIKEGDTVVSSIRLKHFGSEADTNIYAVKTPQGQTWIRAERIDEGRTVAVNDIALGIIHINANKFKHGGITQEDEVVKQVLPESLRQIITSKQILDHKEWMAENSQDDVTQRYTAQNYVHGLRNHSTSPDNLFYASRELLAERVDNRFTIIDLDKKQAKLIDKLNLIPGSKEGSYSNSSYRGIGKGFIITDHSNDVRHVIGQYLVERTDANDPTTKTIQAKEFDLRLEENEKGIRIGFKDVPQGNIVIDIDPEKENSMLWQNNSFPRVVTSEHEGKSYEAKDSVEWNGSHVIAAIADSSDVKNTYDPKIEQNFGLGESHPALMKIHASVVGHTNTESMANNAIEAVKTPRRARI